MNLRLFGLATTSGSGVGRAWLAPAPGASSRRSLAGWLLPPVFGNLRRLLEARMGKAGKREYVQVLRLIESFSLDDVRAAISEALERGVIGFDAVKHLVLCRIEKRPPRLNLLAHPYLPRAEVATTSARSSMGLLKGAAP